MRPLFAFVICVIPLALPACEGAAAEGEGEGEAGEGEAGDEGEGEGGDDVISYVFERDGIALAGDLLDLGEHDPAAGPLDVELALKNTGGADFAILSDPPLLVAGANADFFSVITQPPTVVPAGTAVPFTIRYAPGAGGAHQGKFLFAWGLFPEERVLLTVDASAGGGVRAPGVVTAIYDGDFDLLPDFTTLTPVEELVSATFDITPRIDADFYAYVFTGTIEVDAEGSYTFFTTSDDGSRLFIDGALIVDNDGLHGPVEVLGTLALAPGAHAIRVEFFEKAGGASLLVSWEGPGIVKEEIPGNRLFTN